MQQNEKVQSQGTQKNVSQFKQFIESNKQYLEQRYNEHFNEGKSQNGQNIKLTTIPIQKLLLYIYEIFSLEKYQNNKKVNHIIQSSIQQNVKEFLLDLDPIKLSQNNQLTFENLLQILIFIIGKNSIFAVQYQSKSIINNNSEQQNSSKKHKTKKPNKNLNVKIDISIDNQNQSIVDDQNYQNHAQISRLKKNNFNNSFSIQNQFEISNSNQKNNSQQANLKLIKKNSKMLFDFYCRQQMELGGIITFDRLNQQTYSMSLGKCLTFAKAMNLFNAFIKRQDLVIKFKKVSEGKKYINFEKFQAMIGQFQIMDPNFNQRIGLLSEDIRKILKYVKLPFNTKDTQPRQKIAIRNFSSRLTSHSGQTSQSLKVQLDQKKQEILKLRKLKQIKQYMQWKQSRPEMIKQKDLNSPKISQQKDLALQLSFIGSIVHPQEQDDLYLKDQLIPKLQKQLDKNSRFSKVFETERYQSLDKLTLRKQTVVSDIRKRIKEIEHGESDSLIKSIQRSKDLENQRSKDLQYKRKQNQMNKRYF